MNEDLYWRATYADGRVIDEPDDQSSIRSVPSGILGLVVCRRTRDGRRAPVVGVSVLEDRLPGHGPWMPVFYRRRSLALDLGGQSRTDAVVFGRACEGPSRIAATLWAIRDGHTAENAAEKEFDPTAVSQFVLEGSKHG